MAYLSNHLLDLPQNLHWSWGQQSRMEYCLKWRQPLMKEDLKILKWNISATADRIFLIFHIKIENCSTFGWPPREHDLKIISQQSLIGSVLNFNLKLRWSTQCWRNLKWNTLNKKMEYLSNYWSNWIGNCNLSFWFF